MVYTLIPSRNTAFSVKEDDVIVDDTASPREISTASSNTKVIANQSQVDSVLGDYVRFTDGLRGKLSAAKHSLRCY